MARRRAGQGGAVRGLLAGLALGLLAAGPAALLGCGAAPLDLRGAIVASNALAGAVTAAVRDHERRVSEEWRRRSLRCAPGPDRDACLHAAALETLEATRAEQDRIAYLAVSQRAAAELLEAATQCRDEACERDHLERAERELARVRAGLAPRPASSGGGR